MLLDYFAGQQISNLPATQDANTPKIEFPVQGFDTHAMSAKGVEMITKKDMVFSKTSTTAKTWTQSTLIEYFKDNVVINALPDAPDEQLPTVKLKTHAYTPDEYEIVTYKDRYWKRKEGTTNWETGLLLDYFGTTTFEKGTMPTAYWDIHSVSPTGREIIVVGSTIYYKDAGQSIWKVQTLKEYFGSDFPLEKEIQEKQQVDEENDSKKYGFIKDKVMIELRKFFRPELINRFDEVIIFEPLKFSHMVQIVSLQLKGLRKLMEDQEMGFDYTEAAVKEIVRNGFDPIFGARPLRRAIQKLVENPLSTLIIEGKLKPADTVTVDFDGEEFKFNIAKAALILKKKSAAVVKKFKCTANQHMFETETLPNSTVICPQDASSKVEEIMAESNPVTSPMPQDINQPQDALQMPQTNNAMPTDGSPAMQPVN
jgi:hypothetical protein